jgi:hypothetical protein
MPETPSVSSTLLATPRLGSAKARPNAITHRIARTKKYGFMDLLAMKRGAVTSINKTKESGKVVYLTGATF